MPSYFPKIQSNIIFPSMSRSSKWSPSGFPTNFYIVIRNTKYYIILNTLLYVNIQWVYFDIILSHQVEMCDKGYHPVFIYNVYFRLTNNGLVTKRHSSYEIYVCHNIIVMQFLCCHKLLSLVLTHWVPITRLFRLLLVHDTIMAVSLFLIL
jgi:hypothetical protein